MKRRIFAVLLAACVMAGSVLPAAGTLQARAEGETTDVTQGLTGRWSFDGTDRLANEVVVRPKIESVRAIFLFMYVSASFS